MKKYFLATALLVLLVALLLRSRPAGEATSLTSETQTMLAADSSAASPVPPDQAASQKSPGQNPDEAHGPGVSAHGSASVTARSNTIASGVEPASSGVADASSRLATSPLVATLPLYGSQTENLPTSAQALPPGDLAALMQNSVEAEILEEHDGPPPEDDEAGVPPAIGPGLMALQHRVTTATDAARQQLGFDLLQTFQNAVSDRDKIDVLSLAAELGLTGYAPLLLRAGLAPGESEDVRIQAVFVAADLSPDLLRGFAKDSSEAVREEIKTQLSLP